ncbi:hypothetical protein D3C84_814530 [compost metagenome]
MCFFTRRERDLRTFALSQQFGAHARIGRQLVLGGPPKFGRVLIGDIGEDGIIQIVTANRIVAPVEDLHQSTINYFAQCEIQCSATPVKY